MNISPATIAVAHRFTAGILGIVLTLAALLFAGEVWGATTFNISLSTNTNLSSGLVGWWTLDGKNILQNVVDSSSQGKTGYLTNFTSTTTVSGRIGQGLSFDGADDFVSVPGDTYDDLQTAGFSGAAWIYPKSLGENNRGRILDKANGTSPTNGWVFDVTDLGGASALAFSQDGSTDLQILSPDGSIALNTWQHVAFTWSGGVTAASVKLYINGVETAYDGATHDGVTLTSDAAEILKIGNDKSGVRAFDGIIDDARIYNRVLSPSEILRLYHLGATTVFNKTLQVNPQLSNGLLAHWTFDGPTISGSSITDVSGSGHTATTTSSVATYSYTAVGTTTYTVPVGVTSIIAKAWGGGGGGGRGNSNTATGGGGGFAQATISVTPGETLDVVVGGAGLTAVSVCTTEQAGGGGGGYSTIKRGSTFLIQAGGGGGGGGVAGNGEEGGNGGAGGGSSGVAGNPGVNTAPDLGNGGGAGTTVAGGAGGTGGTGNDGTAGVANSGGVGGSSGTVTCAGGVGGLGGGAAGGAGGGNNTGGGGGGGGRFGGGGGEDGVSEGGGGAGGGSSLVTGSATTETAGSGRNPGNNTDVDYSGTIGVGGLKDADGNSGKVFIYDGDSSLPLVTGRRGQALDFNGVDNYVSTSDDGTFDLTSAVTLAAWVMMDDAPSVSINEYFISKGTSVGNDETYGLLMQNTTPDQVTFRTYDGTTVTNASVPLSNFRSGQWYHVVGVFDSTKNPDMTLYVDGVATGTAHLGATIRTNNANPRLGAASDNSRFFNGKLDDARIYNRALSPNEVSRMYQLGATTKVNTSVNTNPNLQNGLVGYWTFDGPTMYQNVGDSSPNGNIGTTTGQTTGTTTVPGKIGQALFFDGSDDAVNVSNAPTGINTASFSVAFWAKPAQLRIQGFIDRGSFANTWRIFMDDTNGRVEFDARSDAENLVGNATLATSTWSHVTVTYDSSVTTAKLYINGALDATNSSFTNPANTVSPSLLKFAPSHAVPFNGALDDVRFYNRVLSPSEILRLYQTGK